MRTVKTALWVTAAVCAVTPATAVAGDNKQACVPESFGLPGSDPMLGAFYGPPYWVSGWTGAVSGRVLDVRDEDPRWVNAGGASISDALTPGSAMSPVEVRLLSSGAEGAQYLYYSAKLNVGDVTGARVVRIFLRPGGGQPAKMIRVRITPNARVGMQNVPFCDAGGVTTTPDVTCDTGREAHFRVWEEDSGAPGLYAPCNDPAAPVGASCHPANAIPTWLTESLRIWKPASGTWTVQFRAPVVPAGTQFGQGLTTATDVAMDFAFTTATDAAWYVWPRTLPFGDSPMDDGDTDLQLSLPQLADWGSFRSTTGVFAAPTGGPSGNACETISVAMNNGLGVTHDPPGGTNFNTIFLTTQVKGANEVSGMPDDPIRNEFVVRLQNNSTRDIQPGEVRAEFRVAKWGAQIGDVRGDLNSAWHVMPATAPGSNPATNSAVIPAGTLGNVHFGWELSASERCQFGVPTANDLAAGGCTAVFGEHQCIMVDLTGSSSLNVDFETRGTWNNFDFRTLSTSDEVATIDVRSLPIPPTQQGVEVYLVGMARNMPENLPKGTTGAQALAESANATIEYENQVMGGRGYGGVEVTFNPEDVHMDEQPEPRPFDERLWGQLPRPQFPPIYRYLPPKIQRRLRAIGMLGLLPPEADPLQAEKVVLSELGQDDAAAVLPTLDIYVYYKDKGTGRLVPMTGFSYFLAHQGIVEGYGWVIEGAQRLSPNVYRLEMPRESTRDIKVRLQAREPGEGPIVPCSGCCCGGKGPKPASHAMGNFAVPMIGVMFGLGLRRRRKRERDDGDKKD